MQLLPEVLAPVGSREALEAAVRSGADAVYLGLKEFSARRNAENFTLTELKDACEYCHIRGVSVYLTLNIMLRENELEYALDLLKSAAKAGIDAVILQDLGFARLVKSAIPDLPLHASTQMSVHSPSALHPLKKLGFSRVVIAREMSLCSVEEICKGAKALDLEIEMFVHGALCMSVSGQCLMSAILGGRSGNRGLCAGPCRLPFSVENGTGYDLSLKDLSLYKHIDKLKSIGVASLKIEGRMKRPEYVAAATVACRQAVDNGFVKKELSETLKNVFSRSGFTDGYLTEKLGREMFGIRTKEDVTSSPATFSTLHELYRNERQSIPLFAKATIKQNEEITLSISDTKHEVSLKGDIPVLAQKKPCDKQAVINNLSKLGGTPYFIKEIEVNIDNNLYISASALNSLRRAAIDELNSLRKAPFEYTFSDADFSSKKYSGKKPRTIIARFESCTQIPEDLSSLEGIMLPLEKELPDTLPKGVLLIADIPRGIFSEEYIKNRLSLFKKRGFTHAYATNIASLEIARELNFEIIGGHSLNIANNGTLTVLKDFGISSAVVSPELPLSEISAMPSPVKKGIFAYGRLPLMLTRNCPVKNGTVCKDCNKDNVITDRKGISFPVRCRAGFSEIYNSTVIWLGDRLDEIRDIDFLLLYFTDESKEDISTIIYKYKNGGNPPSEYTRGLYYRNLL